MTAVPTSKRGLPSLGEQCRIAEMLYAGSADFFEVSNVVPAMPVKIMRLNMLGLEAHSSKTPN